jgi:hypothetical protein
VPYEVFEGDEGLARLRDPWRSMELRAAQHVFQTFDYAERWQGTIGKASGATPLIVALIEHSGARGFSTTVTCSSTPIPPRPRSTVS